MDKKANILVEWKSKEKGKQKSAVLLLCRWKTCGILSMMVPVRKPSWVARIAFENTRVDNFTLGDQPQLKKGFFSHEKLLFYEKTKREGEEKNFYCHCCRVCVVKGARRQRPPPVHLLGALALCVYENCMINNAPALAVWKGERSNLNSIKWLFFAHNFSSTWCIMVFEFVSQPELTRSFTSLSRKEIVTHFAHSPRAFAFKCLARVSLDIYETMQNRHLLLSRKRFRMKVLFRKPIYED